jgi:DNA-binding CsgD family transcriptional regulator
MARHCQAEPLRQALLSGSAPAEDEQIEIAEPTDGSGASMLTDAERRVAALASLGSSNREIASKLFITASTVEQHLTRVYRKLGVRNRMDLPASLGLSIADTK